MTETTDPGTTDDRSSSAEPDAAEPAAMQRRSVWRRLNRTNRIAALVLGGIGAALSAVLIFGAGFLVGSESGAWEGHHHELESSHDDGSWSEGEGDDHREQEDDGGSERDAEQQDGGESERDGNRGEPTRQQPRSDAPQNPTPRP